LAGKTTVQKQAFVWNAADYAEHSAAQFIWAQELIAKLGLQGDESVLDIGCGDGKVTAVLAAWLPRGSVTGIDSSANMLDLASTRFPPAFHPNLRFQLMDASNLTFNNEFDVAFSNAVLHWIPDHLAVLHGVYRALKPGGRLLFQMGGRGNISQILPVAEQVIARETWQPYFTDFIFPYYFFGPEEYEDWLEQAGFKFQRAELIPKDMPHAGIEGLAGWIRSTWLPYLEPVPAEMRPTFIEEIAGNYLSAYPPDSQGTVHTQVMRLEVEATKNTPLDGL
jgi:trans-aconitate methyltransferase